MTGRGDQIRPLSATEELTRGCRIAYPLVTEIPSTRESTDLYAGGRLYLFTSSTAGWINDQHTPQIWKAFGPRAPSRGCSMKISSPFATPSRGNMRGSWTWSSASLRRRCRPRYPIGQGNAHCRQRPFSAHQARGGTRQDGAPTALIAGPGLLAERFLRHQRPQRVPRPRNIQPRTFTTPRRCTRPSRNGCPSNGEKVLPPPRPPSCLALPHSGRPTLIKLAWA